MIDQNAANALLFLGLDPARELNTPSLRAMNSGSKLPFCNRILIQKEPQGADLEKLCLFMGTTPYTLWNFSGKDLEADLIKNNFLYAASFPIMTANIDSLAPHESDEPTKISLVQDKDSLDVWIHLAAQVYGCNIDEFKIYINYLQSTHQSNNIAYYLGYWKDEPVATSMFITQANFIGVHWVATLSEFRNKGLGTFLTSYPLHQLKKRGATQAVLFSSPLGKFLYKKIGFRYTSNCVVYKSR